MYRKTKTATNEAGFASIVIALILIIVLALLTIGFAQLARREQKSALNKQLASQAYYAAESGVNDTLNNLASLEAKPPPKDSCISAPVTVGPSQNGVQYTCVLVDLNPHSLRRDNIQPEHQWYIVSSAKSSTGNGATSITVNWGSSDGNTTFPSDASGGFTPAQTWNGNKWPGVLEFSVTPLNGPLDRASLVSQTTTVYLYPTQSGGGSVSVGSEGAIVSANCNPASGTTYPCQATITGLGNNTGPYLFRIIDHYDPSNVSINGVDLNNRALGFDGQVLIDSTGKAHEVLKRIQVTVPQKEEYPIPDEAFQAQNACKHFTTDPVGGTSPVTLPQDSAGACSYN